MFAEASEDKCVKVVTEEEHDIIEGQDENNKEFTYMGNMEILKVHESPIGGHACMNKTYEALY
jgi:hypothetical protein